MSLPNANFWIRADLTFFCTAVSESPFTQTLSFTNKPILENTVSELYYPIIQNLSDFGARMSTFVPGESNATLTLYNGLHSLGYNRCITDLLQRYTLINQDVKIYFALDTPDDLDPETWTQIFQGKIDALEYNASDVTQTLSIAIHSDTLPFKQIAPTIPSWGYTLPVATDGREIPTDSAGVNKIAPIVFGYSQIKPVGESYGFGKVYAYGATFKNQFANGGVLKYYAKNHHGAYVYIQSTSSPTTAAFEDGGAATGGFFTWAGQKELIFPFNQPTRAGSAYNTTDTSGTNYLISAFKVQMTSQVGVPPVSNEDRYVLKIYELDDQGLPTIEIARSEQAVSGYPAWTLVAADYTVCFDLNKPVVIDDANNFAWSITQTKDAGSTWSLKMKRYSKAANAKYWKLDGTDLSVNKHPATDTAGPYDYPYFWAYGVEFADVPTPTALFNSDGFGVSFFQANAPFALDGASSPSSISDVGFDWDFLVYVQGLLDDSSGNITGTASKMIQSPKEIVKLLSWEWDGADWVDSGTFDSSAYSATHSTAFDQTSNPIVRKIQGRINNKITLAALYEKICQNSGARIAVRSDGKFGIWGWGTRATKAATIDQSELRILDVSFKGVESIINDASVVYEKFLYTNQLTRIVDNQSTTDFAYGVAWNNLTPTKASEYTRFRPSAFSANNFTSPATNQDSVEAFGKSTLRLSEFDLLGDSSSVEGILSFYFAFYGLPSVFVSCEVPLERYYTLELLDVIEIQHPMLPSFYGSSSHNQSSFNDNGAAPDWKKGVYNPRAETYRAIVESRQFSLGRGQTPTLKLLLRLLNNYPKDPT